MQAKKAARDSVLKKEKAARDSELKKEEKRLAKEEKAAEKLATKQAKVRTRLASRRDAPASWQVHGACGSHNTSAAGGPGQWQSCRIEHTQCKLMAAHITRCLHRPSLLQGQEAGVSGALGACCFCRSDLHMNSLLSACRRLRSKLPRMPSSKRRRPKR